MTNQRERMAERGVRVETLHKLHIQTDKREWGGQHWRKAKAFIFSLPSKFQGAYTSLIACSSLFLYKIDL